MFPQSLENSSFFAKGSYRIILYIFLLIWLLPLFGILVTSVRSLEDLNTGNYWGWPSGFFLIENYSEVFKATPMFKYFFNSIVITLPTVLGTLVLSSLAGYSLAKHQYKGNFFIFAIFIAGNFVPAQILMIPDRDLT